MSDDLYAFMQQKEAGIVQNTANVLRRVVPQMAERAGSAVQNAAHHVGDAVTNASIGAHGAIQNAAHSVGGAVTDAAGAVKNIRSRLPGAAHTVEEAAHAAPHVGPLPAGLQSAPLSEVRNMLPTGHAPVSPVVPGAPVHAPDTTYFDPHAKPGAPAPPVGESMGPSMSAEPGLVEQKQPWWKRVFDSSDNGYGAPESHGSAAPSAPAPAPSAPATAAPAAPTAPAGPNTPYEHFVHGARGMAREAAPWAAGTAAVGAGGYALSRAGHAADEQETRMRDYYANAAHQMPQPLPGMGVYASYDEFANEKIAALVKVANPAVPRFDTLGPAHAAFASQFGNALATKFVSEPIDGLHRILKKKIVDDPKAEATFHSVIQADPDLQKHYEQYPGQVDDTFKALRKFGPSMATSPAVVRSFLRQSMMAGGNMDFATIRMLAETEKFIQNGRGQGK